MKNKKILSIIILSIILFLPLFVFADVDIPNPAKISTIEEFLNAVKKYMWFLVAPLATIMGIWAGILFLTSEGNPEKAKKARDLLKYIVIGVFVAVVASGISILITNLLSP
ncbi:MAG: pilin [Candidatus Pacebacteria bacterium]|nr:pilin [Candidatus Paceibacterota bacterium]